MKSALRLCALALFGIIAIVTLCFLGVFLADGRSMEKIAIRAGDAQHILAAQRWYSPSKLWLPPASIDAADDAVSRDRRDWVPVALPDARPIRNFSCLKIGRDDCSSDQNVQVVWYKITLAPAASGAELRQIYVPRIDTAGAAAVYLDGQIIWQTGLNRLFEPFYKPILINLDRQAAPGVGPRAHTLYIRLSARAKDGGVLSSVWVAQSDALSYAQALREFLQLGILHWTIAAYWILGALSFAIWVRRRKAANSGIYIWFAAMAALAPVFVLPYLGADLPWAGSVLLLWLWTALGPLLLICIVHFTAEVVGGHLPLMERLAEALSLLMTMGVSVYILLRRTSTNESVMAENIIPIIEFTWLYLNIYTIYLAFKFKNRAAYILTALAFIGALMMIHDAPMSHHTGLSENLFLSPYSSLTSLSAYIIILFVSYVRSMEAAERASEHLRLALVTKETELAESHRQLMEIQHSQTLSDERQRMMREMHDGIGASLVSALRFLQHGQKEPAAVAQVLEECIDDLKLSIDSLEPVADDLLMLLSSLRFRLGSRLQGSGITLHWDVTEVPALAWLDASSGMHILRILQDVLTNILKHSRADSLRLCTSTEVRDGRNGIVILVEDNGQPFTLHRADDIGPARKGLGNILSRARMLQGHCQWRPVAHGNHLMLWIPLERNAEAPAGILNKST